MRVRIILLSLVLLVAIFALVPYFGKYVDVVGREAVRSFSELIAALGDKVTTDGQGNFTFPSPSGKERFFWGERVGVEFELEPFLNSGLDITKLPQNFAVSGDKLIIEIENKGFERGNDPAKAFENFVKNNRASIGYHASLGHFGVSLKVSHFEWAEHIAANDKDIVFMLNPAVMSPLGVSAQKLDGWVVAQVEVMDGNRTYPADRLLRFYDIK